MIADTSKNGTYSVTLDEGDNYLTLEGNDFLRLVAGGCGMIAKARTNPLNLCAMPNTLECSINR